MLDCNCGKCSKVNPIHYKRIKIDNNKMTNFLTKFQKIDKLSLEKKKQLTIPLIREIL